MRRSQKYLSGCKWKTKRCQEWDYLSYLYICDADNNSKCSTEFVRWITTYGREGRWITDVSPYLFMLQDDQERRFRYNGANKGELTVTLLFSNWSKGYRAIEGEYLFSGGQFDGTYNDETKYVRQANFTVPQESQLIEIVATITGHGFNQDSANCAEFVIMSIITPLEKIRLMSGTPLFMIAEVVKTK